MPRKFEKPVGNHFYFRLQDRQVWSVQRNEIKAVNDDVTGDLTRCKGIPEFSHQREQTESCLPHPK